MSIFVRRLFNKPLAETVQGIASGTDVTLFEIPWNRLGFLKRVQIGRGCNGASGCIEFKIYDNYQDTLTDTSGFTKRKSITIPTGVDYINHDETQDIPLLGEITVTSSVSGVDVTIAARTL